MDAQNRYAGIHHAAFATSKIDATLHFWQDLLGLKVCLDFGSGDERQIFLGINDHAFLSFFVWTGVRPVPRRTPGRPVKGAFHFDHISLHVLEAEDLLEIQEMLEQEGFPVSDIVNHGFVHSLYTFDPNGISVEFSLPLEGRNIFRQPHKRRSQLRTTELPGPASGQEDRIPEPYFTVPGVGNDLFDDAEEQDFSEGKIL